MWNETFTAASAISNCVIALMMVLGHSPKKKSEQFPVMNAPERTENQNQILSRRNIGVCVFLIGMLSLTFYSFGPFSDLPASNASVANIVNCLITCFLGFWLTTEN